MILRQAIDAGDLARVRAVAAAMPRETVTLPRIALRDALEICLLMRDEDAYEKAAARWVARLALQAREITLDDLQRAAAALDALPHRPDAAMEQLQAVCLRCGVA